MLPCHFFRTLQRPIPIPLLKRLLDYFQEKEKTIGDEMWIIGIAKTPYDKLLGYFRDFHKRRAKKGVKRHFLYNDYAREFGKISKQNPLSEVRYMPSGIITHAWIEVYNYAKLLWNISTT